MPKEKIQFVSSNGVIATETSVRWTQSGHVQICIQRYPLGEIEVRNHAGDVVARLRSPEDRLQDAAVVNSQILNAVLGETEQRWRPFVDAEGNEGTNHKHILSTDGTDTCTACKVPLFAKADEPPVIRRGDSISGPYPRYKGGGDLRRDAQRDSLKGEEIDPTKMFDSPWITHDEPKEGATVEAPVRVSLEDAPATKADFKVVTPARTGLAGSYVLPPADDNDLVGREPDGSVVLWTDPLDRTAINKLIKVLRRARDQAYGRDE